MRRLPLIVIVGPTAVGKSALLYRLVDAVGRERMEIINGDSIQHYRGIDIGSAKPPPPLRIRYRHHLIDVLEPTERYSVVAFAQRVRAAAAGIIARGRVPILCGGSIYFILHLLRGAPQTPPPVAEVRQRLQQRMETDGAAALHRELAAVDPLAAAAIAAGDRLRIIRSLEIYYTTGMPPSRFARFAAGGGGFHALCIKLVAPRALLKRRIAERLQRMFAAGLEDEVAGLVRLGYGADTPALRAIGYRQFFCEGGRLRSVATATERQQVAADILTATTRYAKHQMTFMNHIAAPRSYDGDQFTAILRQTRAFLACRAVSQALARSVRYAPR